MLPQVLERVVTRAQMIFDIEDRYAHDRRLRGPHPRPIEPLRFWLVGREEAAGPNLFAHPEEMVVIRNTGGYHLFFDQVIPYGSKRPIRRRFTAGTYIIRVTSEVGPVRRELMPEKDEIFSQVYQWIELQDVKLDNLPGGVVGMEQPYSLAMEAGYAYPFPLSIPLGEVKPVDCAAPSSGGQRGPTLLRGALHALDGKGSVKATISAPGAQANYRVDSNGQWVLVFDDTQPTNPLTVTVTPLGLPSVSLDNVCVIQGCETSLPETALRGWVLRKGVGVSGANVQVDGLGQSLKVETHGDGQWMVYLPPEHSVLGNPPVQVTVTATLPDGSNPKVQNVSIQPRGTVLVSTFTYS